LPEDECWRLWEHKTGLSREQWDALDVRYSAKHRSMLFTWPGLPAEKRRPWPASDRGPKYYWADGLRPPLWPSPSAGHDGTGIILTAGETDCAVLRGPGDYAAYAVTRGENIPPPHQSLLDLYHRLGVRRVTVLYDLDDAGAAGAQVCAISCRDAGLDVLVAMLPNQLATNGGNDVSDLWHSLGHDEVRFRQAVAGILEAAQPPAPRAGFGAWTTRLHELGR